MDPVPPPPACIAVAYSGGRDSSALLHAVCRAMKGSGLTVHALHVHHGLSDHADDWLRHCRDQCARWAQAGFPVVFHVTSVEVPCDTGASVEAQARDARYAALARLARRWGCGAVLLAHHREDQAETVLLQALRGAGVAGLAAMPRRVERDGVWWERPWLNHSRATIEAYVRRHRLRFIDDDSNDQVRWARNRLRLQVWPALVAAFPHAASALSDVAHQAQDALVSVEALAASDLTSVRRGQGIDVEAWRQLTPARGRHVLRSWLRQVLGRAGSRSLIERLGRELRDVSAGRWPVENGELRLFQGVLDFHGPRGWPGLGFCPLVSLSVTRPGSYEVPEWRGTLHVAAVPAQGVLPSRCRTVVLRARAGGERFQRELGRPARILKKQFQAASVPPSDREGPLLFAGDDLIFVPGLGVDARHWATGQAVQWGFEWRPWPALRSGGR